MGLRFESRPQPFNIFELHAIAATKQQPIKKPMQPFKRHKTSNKQIGPESQQHPKENQYVGPENQQRPRENQYFRPENKKPSRIPIFWARKQNNL